MAKTKKTQGKLARYVNTPEAMEKFRRHYGVPDDVYLEYRFWEDAITGEPGDLIIPVVAVIEGGVRFPMDPLLADFLDYFRISPSQISPNIFRIVNGVAELNRRLGFNLTVHDIIATYFLRTTQHEAFSLRPRDGTGISPVTGVPPETGNQVRFCWTVEFHMRSKRNTSKAHLTDPVALQAVYDSEVLRRRIRKSPFSLQASPVHSVCPEFPCSVGKPRHPSLSFRSRGSERVFPRGRLPRQQLHSSRTLLQLPRRVPEARPVLPGVDTLPSTEDADVEMVGPFIPERDPINAAVLAPFWAPTLEAQGERVRTDGTVLRTGVSGSSTASALCEPLVPSTSRPKAERMKEGRWRAYKEQVRIATLKKDEADLKLEDSQDLLRKALEENSKAGEKILALEAEIAARERGSF
uniref:Uncharacterized protein n=1 Tax=Fagus sylvatica TaxID=28930 RepID=A0A2N9FR61_FAGSY